MNVLATVAQHGIIRALASKCVSSQTVQEAGEGAPSTTAPNSTPETRPTTEARRANPSAISTALLVSSCTKLFPILLVIWPTEARESDSFGFAFRATNYVSWAVLLNNIEALLILLDCGYVIATSLAISGFVARWAVEGWFLSFVGLARDTGPVGDALAAYRSLNGWLTGG